VNVHLCTNALDVSDASVSTHLRLNFQTILEGDIVCFPSKFVLNGIVEIFTQTNCANRFCEKILYLILRTITTKGDIICTMCST
jgi:hypothetical protein